MAERAGGRAYGVAEADVPPVLVVTNDFPPRVGGVQQYVWNVVRNLPPSRVSVLAPAWPGWQSHDAAQPFPIHRWPAGFVWPTADLARRVRSLASRHGAQVILFGHGFPLPAIGPGLTDAGLPYVVLTHGAEVWMARIPGLAGAMRRAWADARAVTAITRATANAIRPVLPGNVPLHLLPPAVDAERFSPDVDGSWVRQRHGLEGRKVILCVSRLVARKGQDVLIQGLPVVLRNEPTASVLISGHGPDRPRLEALAAIAPEGSVVFAGPAPDHELPAYYAACDVFAMPCRSRWGGLEVEGFGIVFLEAAASGKAVVAGRSGGVGEAVSDGETGLLVEGAEPKAVALALTRLLGDPELRAGMGRAGRARVEAGFSWSHRVAQLAAILDRAAS